MSHARAVLVLVLVSALALGPSPLLAQVAEPAEGPILTFEVGTAAVAVDVVVRDGNGNLVKDLTTADFEIYEDGELQAIESFSVIARGVEALDEEAPSVQALPAATAVAAGAPDIAPPARDDQPSFIAFVFDRMSAEGRALARDAASTYMSARQDGDFVGIFNVDLALHLIQPFTDDPGTIRSAFDRAAMQAGGRLASTTGQLEMLQQETFRTSQAEAQATAATAAGGAGGADAAARAGQVLGGGASADRDMARMEMRMARAFEVMERDQAGFATTNSLLAVVNGMQNVPGRKTIVFFSEGMAIPVAVQAQFNSVIHAANRANVAIYTMDAAGLRVHSTTEETRRALEAQARMRYDNLGNEDTIGLLTLDAEHNEDLLRYNPHSGLGQLASQTGGFLIRDTNDARRGFRKITQEMRFHYVLGYTPTNETYNGRFRTLDVKVRRKGLNVFSRGGYFAVAPGESMPLRTYEVPAIAALDQRGPTPVSFPVRATALAFPERGPTAKVPVVVEVPGSVIEYRPEPERADSLAADLAVVARIRNEYRQEVSRVSQHFELSTPQDRLDAARAGNILFYREAELPPGKYTVEVVAFDAQAQTASVQRLPLEVGPATAAGTTMSSLMLIDRVEQVAEADRDPGNPLYYGEALLYPNLGVPYRKSASPVMGFYFTASRVAPGAGAVLEVLSGGQQVGRLPMDLPAANADGRIQHAGALPLGSFAPGAYELRLSLTRGEDRLATRTARFVVAE
jgi:VWFA-related protein